MRLIYSWLYPARNRNLLLLIFVLIASVIAISGYIGVFESWWGLRWPIHNDEINALLNNLAISYVVCFLFHLLQLYIPERAVEKKSLTILSGQLNMLVENVQFLMLVVPDLDFASLTKDSQPVVCKYDFKGGLNGKNKRYRLERIGPDNIDSFLEKTASIYTKVTEDYAFSGLDRRLIMQIQTLDVVSWHETLLNERLILKQMKGKKIEAQRKPLLLPMDKKRIVAAVKVLGKAYRIAPGNAYITNDVDDIAIVSQVMPLT